MEMTEYMKQHGKGLNSDTRGALERIAMEASVSLRERGGIEARSNDAEDFPEVSILGIQRMLEEAYRLGRAHGRRSLESPFKFLRSDSQVLTGNEPVDRNDPDSEGEAVEFAVPTGFSDKAKALMEYLDDTGFIFAYKGQLVLTDESLELTEAGDGSHEAPFGGPRMVCDSWEELERRLEEDYDGMKADGLI